MSNEANGDSESPYRHETASLSYCTMKWAIYIANRGGTAGHHALVLGHYVRGWVLFYLMQHKPLLHQARQPKIYFLSAPG